MATAPTTSPAEDETGYLARLKAMQDVEVERFKTAQKAETERQELINEIINKFNVLSKQHEDLQYDYENAKIAGRQLRQEMDVQARELNQLKLAQESNPLVGVFIDGDGAKFLETFIKDGVEGGEKAAHALQDGIRQQLRKTYPDRDTSNWKIMAVVISSMNKLALAYQRQFGSQHEFVGVSFTTKMRLFAAGFNRGAHHTFSFVDIGSRTALKELTDTKLKETFTMMFPHCKHVFFAGCHDSGYVSFLSPYKHDPVIASKLTLIESYNTNPNYYDLGFRMTSFPKVFCQQNFAQMDALPRITTNPRDKHSPPTSTNHTGTPGASAMSEPSESPAVPPAKVPSQVPSLPPVSAQGSACDAVGMGGVSNDQKTNAAPNKKTTQKQPYYYIANRDDERLDQPLPPTKATATQSYTKRTRKKDFCLLCAFNGPDACAQVDLRTQHGDPNLSTDEFIVLQHKARHFRCKRDAYCGKPECPRSHHCPYGSQACDQGDACLWASTHLMDIRPYKKVYQDGTIELLD